MSAGSGARPPRGALIAFGVLAVAGVVFFARREETVAPPIEADLVVEQPLDTPAVAAPIPELPPTPSSPTTRAALEALLATPDLRAVVSSENAGTPNGRLAASQLLQQAEGSVMRLHELVVQSVMRARLAADSAPLDPAQHLHLREDVVAATDRTLMLADRFRDIRLQAISTARGMLAFMEDNAGHYEVRDGAVRFAKASDQVQFSHFQVNTSRVLGQEHLVRGETTDALTEQEQLLARAGIH